MLAEIRHSRALALVLLSGCLQGGSSDATFEIAAALPTPLDVLVVLDDTTAMSPYQLPRVPDPVNLAAVLDGIYNGAPDLRIGVTTTTTGTLRVSPAVPTGVVVHARNFEDGSMRINYDGTLAFALGSVMNVGAISTAPNAVLESTQRVVDDGFRRDSASLGILMVTSSDDASPQAVTGYAAAIQAQGPALVSAVMAAPGDRLTQFITAFAYQKVTSFEAYNMEAISIFAWLFTDEPTDGCFPVTPSLDCDLVTAHDGVDRTLPACSGSALEATAPCYELVPDTSCASGHFLLLGGGYRVYHPLIIGRCVVH